MITPPRTPAEHFKATRAYRRLREFMRDGRKHTLREMAVAAECSETATSARWRELQYPCYADGFAGFEPHKDRLGSGSLWIYWVTPKAVEQLKLELIA